MIVVVHCVSLLAGEEIIHKSPYRMVLPHPAAAMRAMSVSYRFVMRPMFRRSTLVVSPLTGLLWRCLGLPVAAHNGNYYSNGYTPLVATLLVETLLGRQRHALWVGGGSEGR